MATHRSRESVWLRLHVRGVPCAPFLLELAAALAGAGRWGGGSIPPEPTLIYFKADDCGKPNSLIGGEAQAQPISLLPRTALPTAPSGSRRCLGGSSIVPLAQTPPSISQTPSADQPGRAQEGSASFLKTTAKSSHLKWLLLPHHLSHKRGICREGGEGGASGGGRKDAQTSELSGLPQGSSRTGNPRPPEPRRQPPTEASPRPRRCRANAGF